VAGQLGGDDLGRVDPAPEGALESTDFGSLDASDVAVDGLRDGVFLLIQLTIGGA
jgi:hypothetical protein